MSCLKILVLAFPVFVVVPIRAQTTKADSLLKALPNASGLSRFETMGRLFCEYQYNDYEKAGDINKQFLNEAYSASDSLMIVAGLIDLASLQQITGKVEQSILTLDGAIKIADRNGYSTKLKYIYNLYVLAYSSLAKFDLSMAYNLRSLEIRKLTGDSLDISIAYNNIGFNYENLNYNDLALTHYLKSYEIMVRNNLKDGLILTIANVSESYFNLGNFEQSYEFSQRANKICRNHCSINDQWFLAKVTGLAHLGLKQYDSAEVFLLKSLKISRNLGDNELQIKSMESLARLYIATNSPNQAIVFLNQANLILDASSELLYRLRVYKSYSQAYKQLKNFKQSLHYLEEFNRLHSLIYSGDLSINLMRINDFYKERNNLETIQAQKELLLLKEQSIQQQRIIAIISVAVAALLVVVAVMLWFGLKTRGRINQVLNRKVKARTRELNIRNDELNRTTFEQSMVLEKLNQQLQAFSATLSGLVHTASQDVGDPVAKSYFVKLGHEIIKVKNKTALFGLRKLGHEQDGNTKINQPLDDIVTID